MKRTAPEIIGFHLGWDMREVSAGRYQKYTSPAVYVCGNDYFACPLDNREPRHVVGKDWEMVGSYYGRLVWRSKVGDRA